MMWDIDQMKPLSATVVLSLFTPSFRRSTASSASSLALTLSLPRSLLLSDSQYFIAYNAQFLDMRI